MYVYTNYAIYYLGILIMTTCWMLQNKDQVCFHYKFSCFFMLSCKILQINISSFQNGKSCIVLIIDQVMNFKIQMFGLHFGYIDQSYTMSRFEMDHEMS